MNSTRPNNNKPMPLKQLLWISLLIVWTLSRKTGAADMVPWSTIRCQSMPIVWTESTYDGSNVTGFGSLRISNPVEHTIHGSTVLKNKLYIQATLYRYWVRKYTSVEFTVDSDSNASTANIRLARK